MRDGTIFNRDGGGTVLRQAQIGSPLGHFRDE
jgi:hypothetical protein